MKPYKSTYPSIKKKKLTFPTTTRNLKKQMKRLFINRYTFAVGSALFIGLFFGLFTLYLVNKNDSETFVPTTEKSNAQVETTDDQTHEVVLSLPAMYVIQLGMFSQIENAHQLKDQMEQKNLSIFIWERDGSFYLLSGIFLDELQAKNRNETLTDEGIESFVKQWNVLFPSPALPTEEGKWLEQFILVWQETFQKLHAGENFSAEAWLTKLERKSTDSAATRAFKNNLIEKIAEIDTNHVPNVEALFLYALYQLEKQYHSD